MSQTAADTYIVDGWMGDGPDGRIVLLGRRCQRCGTCAWPPAARCKACGSDQVTEETLGPEAELYSYTIDRMGTFIGRPHLVGQVRFPQGPFVQGFIDGDIEQPPAIGASVDLVPFIVESGGEQLVTYAFRAKEG